MTSKNGSYENGRPKGDASQAKIRPCLNCRTRFLSPHFGVRMCDPCRTVIHNMTEPGNPGGRKARK